MVKVMIQDKTFLVKPLWDEWLLNTDFTSDTNPYLCGYFIDGVKVSREDFWKQYQSEMDGYGKQE